MSAMAEDAKRVLEKARMLAQARGHGEVEPIHVAHVLFHEENSVGQRAVNATAVADIKALQSGLSAMLETCESGGGPSKPSARYSELMEHADRHKGYSKGKRLAVEHLIFALPENPDIRSVFKRSGLTISDLHRFVPRVLAAPPQRENPSRMSNPVAASTETLVAETKTLGEYGTELVAMAAGGFIDPIVGRDKELERVVEVLSRRTKNNPCLIGEPGVGKTAIAEGLAQAIADNKIPTLNGCRLWSLDMGSLVAGAKLRGEFEERMKVVLDAVKQSDGGIILFMDEIHLALGAGRAGGGAMDAANLLKPLLARGEMRVIGATTISEFRTHVEKDAAFERRFQTVLVEEPSPEVCIEMLETLTENYEQYHNVTITPGARHAAAHLSARYITQRFMPDKAIDVLDEACARTRVHHGITEGGVISAEQVMEVISLMSGIPLTKLTVTEGERLLGLGDKLKERVIGQDMAVQAVAQAVLRTRAGLGRRSQPVGSFLFLGPTGVGKTELGKALAEELFDDESHMVRLDMSEYSERHSIQRLIGSPPGFIGHDAGGQLTEAVRTTPHTVVLFDEVEKAHVSVLTALLQVMDDGRLTDGKGRTVDFSNTVIILTSNLGATSLLEAAEKDIDFGPGSEGWPDATEKVMNAVKKKFPPELINRLDDMLIFSTIGRNDLINIVDLLINNVEKRLKEAQATRETPLDIRILLDPKARDHIVDTAYEPAFGVRPLRRYIEREIVTSLATAMVKGELGDDNIVHIGVADVGSDDEKLSVVIETHGNLRPKL